MPRSLDNYETPHPNYRDVLKDADIIRLPDADQTNVTDEEVSDDRVTLDR